MILIKTMIISILVFMVSVLSWACIDVARADWNRQFDFIPKKLEILNVIFKWLTPISLGVSILAFIILIIAI